MKELKKAAGQSLSVLVLTDFSEASKDALRWGAHMARQHQADLKVLYPYRLVQLNAKDNLVQLKKKIESEAKNDFLKLADSVFKDSCPTFEFNAEVGFINDRIYSYTRQNQLLLIVLSQRMANNNREAMGELIDHVRTPLVIVPENDSHEVRLN